VQTQVAISDKSVNALRAQPGKSGRSRHEGHPPVRIVYSFPHKLGESRICHTAWQQVNGLAAAGAEMIVFPGVLHKPVAEGIKVRPTLAWGKFRVPYRLLGRIGSCRLHDLIVAWRIQKLAGKIDIVHTWPLGARQTLRTAARLGIATVLERPNAHTKFAYEVVAKECEMLGIAMPPGHEHDFNEDTLRIENEEYELADRLLCPSDFVARTFIEKGFSPEKLARHQYGFDEKRFFADGKARVANQGLSLLFAGGCAPRKGLHYALQAWLESSASRKGTFSIAGAFIPGYAEKLAGMLAHPSVKVLGHRGDLPELMRQADALVLPSIEEGSALVTSEARGSGCVLLVSEAAGAICKHLENALVHRVGDVKKLAQHITLLDEDRVLLHRLRASSLNTINEITWSAAGVRLLEVYREVIASA
jgi:glycosyltransferase involved in cell wall biosynthesis